MCRSIETHQNLRTAMSTGMISWPRRLAAYVTIGAVAVIALLVVHVNRENLDAAAMYRRSFYGIPDGVVVCESDSSGHMSIVLVNKAVEKLTGYTEKELQGQGLSVLMPDSLTATRHQQGVARAKEVLKSAPTGWTAERRYVAMLKTKQGELVTVAIATRGAKSGDRMRFVATLQDVDKAWKGEDGKDFKLQTTD